MKTTLTLLAAAAVLAGCGGGSVRTEAPLSAAAAQVAPPPLEMVHLFGILRPGSDGVWYIQADKDHLPRGIVSVDKLQDDHLTINFDRNYAQAGAIIVSPDDDFGPIEVRGYSNLGLSSANIQLYVRGVKVRPSDILNHAPTGAGNFWISIDMWRQP